MLTSAIAHLPYRPAKARSSHDQAGRNREAGPALQPAVDWGEYESAIRRWEGLLRLPAPPPTEHTADGKLRLSAAFVEWMLGLPPGFVTGISVLRSAHLRILGNGVVPQQAAVALGLLIELADFPGPPARTGTSTRIAA